MSVPTRGEVFSQLLYHLRMVEEKTATMAHLHNTETGHLDKLAAEYWLEASKKFNRLAIIFTKAAQGHFH